jgi:hypothetical protein
MSATLPLQIQAGQSLSEPLSIAHGMRIARIGMPPDWTAAPLSFMISADNVTWWDLYHVVQSHEGPLVSYAVSVSPVAPGSIVLLPAGLGASLDWIKFRSGTKSQPVNQSADRTFTILFRTRVGPRR